MATYSGKNVFLPHSDKEWKLVDDGGFEVKQPMTVEDGVQVYGYRIPHKESSSGRVYTRDAEGNDGQYFPHCYNMYIVKR